ncbi:MAG: hypothetical protein Q4E05_08390 [Pseudoclavibacter sp.]|nr:hypothetical protein [Pseudoclavibacter sp.]
MPTGDAVAMRDAIICDPPERLDAMPDERFAAVTDPASIGERMAGLVPVAPGAYGRLLGPVYSTRPPDPRADPCGFPAREPPVVLRLGGAGRFELPEPEGTCSLVDEPDTAARELVGPDALSSGMVADAFLIGRSVSRLRLSAPVRAAAPPAPARGRRSSG